MEEKEKLEDGRWNWWGSERVETEKEEDSDGKSNNK